MWESFFGFKKTPFSDSPDGKQLFASQAWNQVKTRLEFLAQEMGREVNTIGAKSDLVQITNHVVEMKLTLEKVREQVQNLE